MLVFLFLFGNFMIFYLKFSNFSRISIKESEKILKSQAQKHDMNFDLPSGASSPVSPSKPLKNPNFDLKQSFSIYLKILLNYAQMIGIIHSIDLKWPFYADDYLTFTTKVGVSPTEIISFQCILWNFNVTEKYIHVKALIALLIPFFFMGLIIFFLTISKIFTKRPQMNRIFVSFIVLSVYLQPTVLQNLFDNINTLDLNNKTYLTNELTLEYYDENHQKWVN